MSLASLCTSMLKRRPDHNHQTSAEPHISSRFKPVLAFSNGENGWKWMKMVIKQSTTHFFSHSTHPLSPATSGNPSQEPKQFASWPQHGLNAWPWPTYLIRALQTIKRLRSLGRPDVVLLRIKPSKKNPSWDFGGSVGLSHDGGWKVVWLHCWLHDRMDDMLAKEQSSCDVGASLLVGLSKGTPKLPRKSLNWAWVAAHHSWCGKNSCQPLANSNLDGISVYFCVLLPLQPTSVLTT